MSGLGMWIVVPTYNRCSGARKCGRCKDDPAARPHGPYYRLRRRDPQTGKQEAVYLGTKEPDREEVARLNRLKDVSLRSREIVKLLMAPR